MYKAEEETGENADYLFPEIDNLDFEADLDKAFEEIEALHREKNEDDSLEKAVSTEDIASAKTRGLVPQSGNWQKPGRWIRPKDADVPVDEEKEEKPRKKAGSGVVWPLDDETNKLIENIFGAGVDISDFQNMYSIGLDDFYTEIEFLYGVTKPSYPGVSSTGKLSVSVDLYTEDEETYAGGMARYFTREDGKIIVTHDSFSIEKKYQGKGIAADINENAEKEYERLGVSEIRLDANSSIGGYAWARQGYDFSDKEELEGMRRRFLRKLNDIDPYEVPMGEFKEIEALKEQFHMKSDEIKGFNHAWEFAAWNPTKKRRGQHLGKKWMLGTNWEATKILDKESLGYQIGKAYFAGRKNASRKG